ncbi:MAG: hypothetical protein RJA16_1043 [Planctomycetota bacterium]|jgi:methyl-accepting chemotaxis protein
MFRSIVLSLSLVSLVGGVTACQAPAVQASNSMSQSFAEVGRSITRVEDSLTKIAANLELLATVQSRDEVGSISKLFSQYQNLNGNLTSAVKKMDEAAKANAKQVEGYFKKRNENNATITVEALRKTDADQIASLQASQKSVADAYAAMKAKVETLVTDAASFQTYLANNLNLGGVEAAGPQMQGQSDQIRSIEPMLKNVATQYQQLSASLVPPKSGS